MEKETSEENQLNYYIEASLKKDLDRMKALVLGGTDEDMVIIIDGRERSGKSVLALQVAKYLDPSFDVDSVCYNAESFTKFIMNNRRRAVVYDEAITGLNSSRRMEKSVILIDELLAQSGQKNLFTILVVPFFFELTKRTAVGRSEFLIHVRRDSAHRRGHYQVFDYANKRKLYFLGKRLFEYQVRGADAFYRGYFPHIYPVDEKAYRKKKAESLATFTHNKGISLTSVELGKWMVYQSFLTMAFFRDKKQLKLGGVKKFIDQCDLTPERVHDVIKTAYRYIRKNELEDYFVLEGLNAKRRRLLGLSQLNQGDNSPRNEFRKQEAKILHQEPDSDT